MLDARCLAMLDNTIQSRTKAMTEGRRAILSGGCQCGAVRYALYALPVSPSICHCRMCQKAMGNLFMASAAVPLEEFAWTRGEPATFRSSSVAERGFCARCGTPLFFRPFDALEIEITLGSLDEPARVKPRRQVGIESRVPWLEGALALPGRTTEEGAAADVLVGMRNLQHPDRDA
jgi:hypothetical protein